MSPGDPSPIDLADAFSDTRRVTAPFDGAFPSLDGPRAGVLLAAYQHLIEAGKEVLRVASAGVWAQRDRAQVPALAAARRVSGTPAAVGDEDAFAFAAAASRGLPPLASVASDHPLNGCHACLDGEGSAALLARFIAFSAGPRRAMSAVVIVGLATGIGAATISSSSSVLLPSERSGPSEQIAAFAVLKAAETVGEEEALVLQRRIVAMRDACRGEIDGGCAIAVGPVRFDYSADRFQVLDPVDGTVVADERSGVMRFSDADGRHSDDMEFSKEVGALDRLLDPSIDSTSNEHFVMAHRF